MKSGEFHFLTIFHKVVCLFHSSKFLLPLLLDIMWLSTGLSIRGGTRYFYSFKMAFGSQGIL
jgi:hypothetical protein